MNILAISMSPRAKGSTVTLLEKALEGAREAGAETELYSVAGKKIEGCDGCWGCMKTGQCHIKDDMQGLYDKMVAADGIIFGMPIYFYGMSAQAKTVMDRTMCLNQPERSLMNKVGAVTVDCGSLGLVDALKDWYFYIVSRRMIPANQVAAYAIDLPSLEKCLQAALEQGKQMVAIAKQGFKYPPEYTARTIAYGTHTK